MEIADYLNGRVVVEIERKSIINASLFIGLAVLLAILTGLLIKKIAT